MNSGLKIVRLVAGIEDLYLRNLADDSRLIHSDDFGTGVDTELAFDAVIANQLVKHTTGFVITDAQYGKVAGTPTYRDFGKALSARDGAKLSLAVDVDLDDEEPTADPAGGGESESAPVE